MVIDFDPNLMQPMTMISTHKWRDGLFDVCWSEKNSGVCCTASGDGSVVVWNETRPVGYILLLKIAFLNLLLF